MTVNGVDVLIAAVHTFDGVDLASVVLLAVFLWLMRSAHKAGHSTPFAPERPGTSLACRLAPYRGGWFPRTEPVIETETETEAEAVVLPFERPGELVEFPGYSVKAV